MNHKEDIHMKKEMKGKLTIYSITTKLLICSAIIVLLGCGHNKVNGLLQDGAVDNGYTLMWEDDFDGDELDLSSWNYEYHEPGWVNNELQEYTDSDDNIYLEDGKLIIQALKKEVGSEVTYTSGRINTKDKHDYKYGKFEVRAKVPNGKGFLPAFWMMPTDENLYGQWPKCGEIDIMEVLGDETDTVHGTLHFGEPHTSTEGTYELVNGDFSSDFHVYSCEWEPGEIRFYVDGTLYYTENDWFTKRDGFGEITYPAPFDQPFYLILNLAVGGNWPGNPDEDAVFGENARFVIDYVKAYQKDYYDEDVERPEEDLIFDDPDEEGNYVVNGDFSDEEDFSDDVYWQLLLAGEGDASAAIINDELRITTLNPGTLDYSVQLVEAHMPMIQGKKYQLSFDAYASSPRSMIVNVTGPDKGYKRYLEDSTVELTEGSSTYTFDFDITDKSDVNGRIEFNLGNQNSQADVYLTNVSLKIIGDVPIPEVEKSVLPDGNYVYNGEFQEGPQRMKYWEVHGNADTNVSVTNNDNIRELKAEVSNADYISDVTVKQDAIALSHSKDYILSFSGYADNNAAIKVRISNQTFDCVLSTEQSMYSYSFTTGADIDLTELVFLLGKNGTMYLDNIRITEDSLLINGDFTSGMVGYELYAATPTDVSYVIDELNEDKAISITIKNTGDADWKIQLKQNNIQLIKGKSYRISFDAKSTLDRDMMYALQRDGSSDDDWTPYSGTQIVALKDTYQTFTHEFTMEGESDPNTILSLSMGAVNGVQLTTTHDIVIDNIQLEEISN